MRYKQRFECNPSIPALLFTPTSLTHPPSSPPIIMRHLQPRPLKPTLDIKTLIGLTTVQNRLIAADLLRDKVERLNNPEPEFLALLILGDGNVLNVPDEPELVDEFALDDERARADDGVGAVGDAEEVVRVVARGHPGVALVPLLLGGGLAKATD